MLSKSSMHAVRAMVVLADLAPGTCIDVSRIAGCIHAPRTYLSKVMCRLSRAGLIHCRRGRAGGYRLARPADRISMFEVLEPFEHFDRWNGEVPKRIQASTPLERSPIDSHLRAILVRYIRIIHEISLADVAADVMAAEGCGSAVSAESCRRECCL